MAAPSTAPPTVSPDAHSAAGPKPRARKPRPVRIPTFALVSQREPFAILEEHAEQPALGYALWRLANDALVFATAADRRTVFASPSHSPLDRGARGPVPAALRALAFGLRQESIDMVEDACVALSAELERRRARLTAAVFAEAVALIRGARADAALRVATLAQNRSAYPAAEWWAIHAVEIARASDDSRLLCLAFRCAGDAAQERGLWSRAVRFRRQQMRAARRSAGQSRRDLFARATHSLAVAYWYAGNRNRARFCFRAALHLYSASHPRLYALAHDLARTMVETGEGAGALPLLVALLNRAGDEREQLVIAVNLARAAAQAGDEPAFRRGSSTALTCLQKTAYSFRAAEALNELAEAGMQIGWMEEANTWVRSAAQICVDLPDSADLARTQAILGRLAHISPLA